jgi:vacuolar-type H+-ATPase subunit H
VQAQNTSILPAAVLQNLASPDAAVVQAAIEEVQAAIKAAPDKAAAIAAEASAAAPAQAAVITAAAISEAPDQAESIIIAVTDKIVALSEESDALAGYSNESTTTYGDGSTTDQFKGQFANSVGQVVRDSYGDVELSTPKLSIFRGLASPE